MRLPPDAVCRDPRERRRILESIARQAERERQKILQHTPPSLGSRTVILLPAIVVLSILGVLLGLRSRQVPGERSPHWLVAERELQVLAIGLSRFRLDTHRYPSSEEGLSALRTDPGAPGWRGPYINRLRNDPWGQPYRYEDASPLPHLRSSGPDGIPGTALDIRAAAEDLQKELHPSPPIHPPPWFPNIRIGRDFPHLPEPSE